MSRSLSLAAYRALARRQPYPENDSERTRPGGEVVWAHATSHSRYTALCDLGLRLGQLRPDLHMLISFEREKFVQLPSPRDGCDHIVGLISDHPVLCRDFLEHWSPDICLWTGGDLMPNLVCAASEKSIPMIMLDVGPSDFPTRRHKWFPDLTRTSLEFFDSIMVNKAAAAQMLKRVGVSTDKISVTDRLRNIATPPACSDEELAAVTQNLAGRPIWLAAHVKTEEFAAVLKAHKTALRLVHRLLLILITDDPEETDSLKKMLTEADLRHIDWDTGDSIEDSTQVVVSRDDGDLGLWYRAAPLSFIASSLVSGSEGRSPLEAAALGSAILYGPNVDNHMESYARLAAAGAARAVRDGESLGNAVLQLVAPDLAAEMALAGWEVVTEGAHLTDNLTDLILDMLDMSEATHASS